MSPMDRKNYHPDWESIADSVVRKANHRCELCTAKAGGLHWLTRSLVVLTVHHIDGNQRNNHVENLIALCQRCHLRLDRGLRSHRKARTDVTWPKGVA
jgi:5-methylcytosine-specific restriction endonuclease McrA